MYGVSIEDVRNSVNSWNIRFPIDRWWREKHGIPFGSKDHRDANFIDMLFEYTEDVMINEVSPRDNKGEYKAGHGQFLNERLLKEDELDDFYDNIKFG